MNFLKIDAGFPESVAGSLQDKAISIIFDMINEKYPEEKYKINDVYVVWQCKTLQNFKCLLSTSHDGDGLYFELTYNGDKHECYVDEYKKVSNTCIGGK